MLGVTPAHTRIAVFSFICSLCCIWSQSFGAEHLHHVEKGITAENSAQFDKPKERSYPGVLNIGRSRTSTGVVPPPYPHPKVRPNEPFRRGVSI